jgi:hypothetical protein
MINLWQTAGVCVAGRLALFGGTITSKVVFAFLNGKNIPIRPRA